MVRLTTTPGYLNKNSQRVVGQVDLVSNHHNQRIYEIVCERDGCGERYGANGCDIHIRKCPTCQGGASSSVLSGCPVSC